MHEHQQIRPGHFLNGAVPSQDQAPVLDFTSAGQNAHRAAWVLRSG